MHRLPENSPDHFAMFIQICMMPEEEQKHSAPKADGEELQEAKKLHRNLYSPELK